jgi:hypothetical protein
MCRYGYIALELGTSARQMMLTLALGKQGRFQMMLCQHRSKKIEKNCNAEAPEHEVGTLEFFTVLTTNHLHLCKELHYEGGIFIQKLYSVLKIFTTEGSHWWPSIAHMNIGN